MRFIILAPLLLLAACTNQDATRKTLMDYGFTDIKTGGYSFSCGKGDGYCTAFTAVNPQGRPVSGAVGCGLLFKGCTVRF